MNHGLLNIQTISRMGIFSNIKDELTNVSAKLILKKKIESYGKLIDFDINSSEKNIYISVLLKGEDKPVQVDITGYKLIGENPLMIEISGIRSNREWITRIAEDYIKDKQFPLPEKLTPFIKLLL